MHYTYVIRDNDQYDNSRSRLMDLTTIHLLISATSLHKSALILASDLQNYEMLSTAKVATLTFIHQEKSSVGVQGWKHHNSHSSAALARVH